MATGTDDMWTNLLIACYINMTCLSDYNFYLKLIFILFDIGYDILRVIVG
jgi:hypothetical protein